MYPVYCHMSSLSMKCGAGGWTLVMKLDRDKVKHTSHKFCIFSRLIRQALMLFTKYIQLI